MNFKDVLENECGNVNPLMRLGKQMTADTALRDEGISANFHEKTFQPEGVSRHGLCTAIKNAYQCTI